MHKQKVRDSAKNRTVRSSPREVISVRLQYFYFTHTL